MIPAAAGGFPWESERQDVQLREMVVHLAVLRRSGALAGDEISLQSAGDALIIIRYGIIPSNALTVCKRACSTRAHMPLSNGLKGADPNEKGALPAADPAGG